MMAAEGRPPGQTPASAVQPACPDPGNHSPQVPQQWLSEFERSEAARRLERLAADQDLVTRLALQRYEGAEYDVFETELAKYGIDVITGWLVRGLIFAKCKERGFGGLPAPPGNALQDRDTIGGLAGETVAKALYHFRQDVLMRGRWVGSRGASLKTFFVGQCLIRFANIYRAWWTSEVDQQKTIYEVARLETAPRITSRIDGPESNVVDHTEVHRLLGHIKDHRVKTALVLTVAGWSQEQIADRMGITEKAVERMLANNRDRLKRLGVA
jgi:hypothetical protein